VVECPTGRLQSPVLIAKHSIIPVPLSSQRLGFLSKAPLLRRSDYILSPGKARTHRHLVCELHPWVPKIGTGRTWLPIVPIRTVFYHTLDFHRGANHRFHGGSGAVGIAGCSGNSTVLPHWYHIPVRLGVNFSLPLLKSHTES
jgi:hypothetical protein